MSIAIEEAKKSLFSKDFPVGAVLVINGKYIGKSRNTVYSKKNWTYHAELKIIKKYSNIIKNAVKEKKEIKLYTTLEPCFMCFGTAIVNKITKIIFACPDPSGGMAYLNPKNFSEWYQLNWPRQDGGLLKEESYKLLKEFMKKQERKQWKIRFKQYEDMTKKWKN